MIKDEDKTKDESKETRKLEDLLTEAQDINSEIKNISEDFDSFVKEEESEISKASEKTVSELAELDQNNKEAEKDFEKIMMENAEEIAREEKEEEEE